MSNKAYMKRYTYDTEFLNIVKEKQNLCMLQNQSFPIYFDKNRPKKVSRISRWGFFSHHSFLRASDDGYLFLNYCETHTL